MLELVTQLESGKQPKAIPNLWIKNGDSIEKNANSPFLQDLIVIHLQTERYGLNGWRNKQINVFRKKVKATPLPI